MTTQLDGYIFDVTRKPPQNISSITVKAPAARIGGGGNGPGALVVSSPATVDIQPDGRVSIKNIDNGLSWLFIEGPGWSDSVPLVVADGMTTIVEAAAAAARAQRGAETAKSALENSIKPAGGWPVADLEKSVRDAVRAVQNAADDGLQHGGHLAKFAPDGQLYVPDPNRDKSAARKDYVDGQIAAAKKSLKAAMTVAATPFITGIGIVSADAGRMDFLGFGTANDYFELSSDSRRLKCIKNCRPLILLFRISEDADPSQRLLYHDPINAGKLLSSSRFAAGYMPVMIFMGLPED